MRVTTPEIGQDESSMARRRHTPDQILTKLRDADVMITNGQTLAEVAKQLEVSEQTYHQWRNQYGGRALR